jgi:hypothetical protein
MKHYFSTEGELKCNPYLYTASLQCILFTYVINGPRKPTTHEVGTKFYENLLILSNVIKGTCADTDMNVFI